MTLEPGELATALASSDMRSAMKDILSTLKENLIVDFERRFEARGAPTVYWLHFCLTDLKARRVSIATKLHGDDRRCENSDLARDLAQRIVESVEALRRKKAEKLSAAAAQKTQSSLRSRTASTNTTIDSGRGPFEVDPAQCKSRTGLEREATTQQFRPCEDQKKGGGRRNLDDSRRNQEGGEERSAATSAKRSRQYTSGIDPKSLSDVELQQLLDDCIEELDVRGIS